jgi:hypothetical protein
MIAERLGITASAVGCPCPANRLDDAWARTATHYQVTLRRGARRMTVPFFMGSALKGPPTADEVLECLLSDASGLDDAAGFEEWAREYGYDPDSRKAKRTYREVCRHAENLRRFLGDDYASAVYGEPT